MNNMSLKFSIAREDDYRKEIVNYYNSILNGRLLSFDLCIANDSDILSFISYYDENESYFNNCCSWLEIGGIGCSNYNGRDFQFIKLLTKTGETIEINFSQFIYEMSVDLGQEGFTTFNSEKAVHVCSIDGQRIDPLSFFSTNKGKRLLYLYSYPAVTAFNKTKMCFKFAFNNISASYLRKYIHDVQMAVLQRCIAYPAADAPYTSIKIEVEGATNSRPSYQHFVKSKITDDFAINIFESDFKESFMSKFEAIEAQ
jgi:hypothetical protein